MTLAIPQLIPKEKCLSCDGCCRFKEPSSSWRPKISIDEIYQLRNNNPALAQKIFSKDNIDLDGYIKVSKTDYQCQCVFFDQKKNACGIYHEHPFECRLYPFILSLENDDLKLYMHISCPFVLENLESKLLESYKTTLKDFFKTDEVIDFLSVNKEMMTDYSMYMDELEFIMTIDLKDESSASNLLNKRFYFDRVGLDQKTNLGAHHLANAFAWQNNYTTSIETVEGATCLFMRDDLGSFMSMPPVGVPLTEELIMVCLNELEQRNGNRSYGRIENISEEQIKNLESNDLKIYKKGYEYLYYRKDLIELAGNEYKSKRSSYNQFVNNYNYEYCDYDHSMKDECISLYDTWADQRSDGSKDLQYLDMIKENRAIHQIILQNASELGMLGTVVKVDNKVKAYSFGMPISDQTYVIYLEIADLSIQGLSSFIFRTFVSDNRLSQYSFINVMDDSMLENLKQVKMSYRPKVLMPLYSVSYYD